MLRFIQHRLLLLLSIIFFAQACAPQLESTPFRPPTQPAPTSALSTTTPIPQLYTPIPTPTITATIPISCTDSLSFIDDITVADGASFSAGASIDKQWLVQNSGTCNWDSTYQLKWIGGDPLGAATEQPLYPARAGTQATLRIIFSAPIGEGPYESAWQAVNPDGNVFGDLVFIKILVTP